MNEDFKNRRIFFIKKYLAATKYYLRLCVRRLKYMFYILKTRAKYTCNQFKKKINICKNFYKKSKRLLANNINHISRNLQIRLLKNFILKKPSYYHTHNTPKPASQYRVACILDEFSYKCFEPELSLVKLNCKNFLKQIKKQEIDFLFVESAWRGSDGQWQVGKHNFFYRLLILTNYCKKNSIPTVFWSKEDPVHFSYFIETAKFFDYVFTTDQNMVNRYKQLCGHNDVYVLEFAMQPKIHNPIKTCERERKICFSGSYYQNRYFERKKFLDTIFSAVIKTNELVIYDRNYTKEIENLKFPFDYQKYIKGNLPYNEIDKAYKGFIAAINVNTVIDSPTMMSRRVYELIACYTPVISNYSLSVANNFSDVVIFFDENQTEDQQQALLKQVMNENISKNLQEGLRKVLNYHTYQHRAFTILDKLKLLYEKNSVKILVITIVDDSKNLQLMQEQFQSQTYPDKEFIAFSNNVITDNVLAYDEIEKILRNKNFDAFAYFNPGSFYGRFYLEDLCNSFKYAETGIVTKTNFYTLKNHALQLIDTNQQFVYREGPVALQRSLIKKNSLQTLNLREKTIHGRYFAVDAFNYVENFPEFDKEYATACTL